MMLVLLRLLALCRPCAVSAQVGRSISGIPVECLPHVACILGVLAFVLTGVSWGSCADFCVAQQQCSCSCPCCHCCPCCPAASGHSVLTVSWLLPVICCRRRIAYSMSSHWLLAVICCRRRPSAAAAACVLHLGGMHHPRAGPLYFRSHDARATALARVTGLERSQKNA